MSTLCQSTRMKTVTIVLPDAVVQRLVVEATRKRVDIATLCSAVVGEHFLNLDTTSSFVREAESRTVARAGNKFDVRTHFPGHPLLSTELAQRFVDEALKLPRTTAFASERGVGIEPNFVFVEYLLKRHPGGIGVSFYGSADKLGASSLRLGRNPNYSRSVVYGEHDLKPLLALIPRSYQLKLG